MRDCMGFFAELKRRHVVQVGIAYLIAAWGIAQVCELILETFDTPPWVMQLILAALGLGLPLALVLAWIHNWRANRLHRGSNPGDATVPVPAPVIGKEKFAVEHESIAVLPFVNMSSDPEQEYFSDGIAEELLNLLTRIPELRVAARTSAFSFKGKNVKIPEIADRLRVAHVLEGSVRKAGERIRITAQLISAENGYHLWSESWDRTLDDIFTVQEEIAAEVAQRLKVTLLHAFPAAQETDPGAYALYLQARHLSRQQSADSYEHALLLLEQVLEIAPDYAPAAALQASIYCMQADYSLIAHHEGHARAREAVARALASQPNCAQALGQLGWVEVQADLDFADAASNYLKALAIDPTDPDLLGQAANVAMMMGRFDTALALFEYLVERDPISPNLQCDLGSMHMFADRYDTAIAHWRTALQLAPGQLATEARIAMALLAKGDVKAALEASELELNETFRTEAQAHIYAVAGPQESADAALARLLEYGEDAALNIVGVLARRGEIDRAFDWLETALENHDTGLKYLAVYTKARALHGDPRWHEFLTRTGMSPEQLNAIEFDLKPPD